MTLQAVRTHFEQAVRDGVAVISATLPVLTDNQLYTDNDAEAEFVLVRLNFGAMTEPTFCEEVERIRAALVVEIFTKKGVGPGRGQRIATEVMKKLNALPLHKNNTAPGSVRGRVNSMVGPSFTPLDGRPHLMTRLSCSLQASYT